MREASGLSVFALRERKRLLDAAWVLTLGGVALALGGAWFLRLIHIDLAPLATAMFAYTGLYLAGALLADRLERSRWLLLAAQALQATGVLFLAWLWHRVGGVDNPIFVLAFVLPVVGSAVLPARVQPYLVALLSVVAVTTVALAESPELRWYLSGLGWAGDVLVRAAPAWLAERVAPFPDVVIGPAYLTLLLALFATFQVALAVTAESLSTLVVRLYGRVGAADDVLERVQGLFQAVLRGAPTPGAIVYADTGQVVDTTVSFQRQMLVTPADLASRTLFEVVHFAEPEALRRALARPEGEIPFCVYTVDAETRIASVRVHSVEHAGTRYAYVAFHDLTEVYYLNAVFDGVKEPLLVIGSDGRLLYANRATNEVFPDLHFGMDLAPILDAGQEGGTEWWRSTEPGERQLKVRLGGASFRASLVAAPLPGAAGSNPWAVIVTLHSLAVEERLYDLATRDALTGLFNRRYFADALARHVSGGVRGAGVALGLLDMDYFKQINDQLGHPAGDKALTQFAETVRRRLRGTDVLARMGGDEFAVLFVDASADKAREILQRVYDDLEVQLLEWEGDRRKLSFSSGVAGLHAGDSVETLTARADEALYEAKEAGRGRCALRP